MTTPHASRPPTRGPTLGVLADWLEGEYQSPVVGGIVEAARESGANLVFFNSCMLRAPFRLGERHNVVYDLAQYEGVDGIVLLAGTLANHHGVDDLARYCERYRPRPMSSIAAALDGTTGVLVDSQPALREGIRHLVDDHQFRRFAFIGGPEGNLEARERLQTYREVLTDCGLRPQDSSNVTGDYQYESGVDAVRILVDERASRFDAIVAANDTMALGAIDALRVRNIRVPRDVAIIGFDDISEARYSSPPLTTIRQPLRQEGRVAVEILLRRLRGEHVDDAVVLPAELVVRRSCGCYSDGRRVSVASNVAPQVTPPEVEFTVEDALRLRRPLILEAMREPVSGLLDGIPEGWDESLLEALIGDLGGASTRFVERVNTLLKETIRSGATGNPWQPALTALHRELMPCLASEPVMRTRAEDLLAEARVLVGEAVEDAQAQHRLRIERRTRALSQAAEILSAAVDLESLGDALRECLLRLSVPSAYLVLDEDVATAGARVVFAHDPGRDPAGLEGLRRAPIEGTSMPDGLLPVDRPYAMVVEPLFFKDDPLGYAVFEMGPTEAFTYEALRVRISGALKVALLVEELRIRVGELRQAQKMETLGQLSGAIAHDFNNLLQAIRGYAELAGIAEPDSGELAADLEEIVRASDRASQLTRQLLTFSQPTRANAQVVEVNACVSQAIPMIGRLLGPTIKLTAVLGPDAGNIVIDPTQLEQALVNLCVNGRDAMPEGGSVTIETGRRLAGSGIPSSMTALQTNRGAQHPSAQAMTFVAVSDTGLGIPPEVRERIFEPFFTTKETGQGTGLGLSIVYGIVRNAFGDILVESEPGHGTRFLLMFPTSGAAEAAAASGAAASVHGTETILLVEDEEAIRKLAERVLTDRGYRVLSAANAVEARELWSANEGGVDLLLSDVTMPGLSGVAFAAELAAGTRPPRTLFISGRLPGEPAGPSLPEGSVFLPKPFSVSGLLDAVRATLDLPAAGGNGRAERETTGA